MLRSSTILVALLFLASGLLAQTAGQPWRGAAGVTETVEQIMARERGLAGAIGPPRPPKPEREANRSPRPDPDAPQVAEWPAMIRTNQPSPDAVPAAPQTVGFSFPGVQLSESGFIPPDCMGSVSETQVLVIVNGRIKVYSKTGVLGGLNASTNTFFQSVRDGSITADPHARYDRLSGRWFIVMINVADSSNRILLAVSDSSTITGSSSFTFYQFSHDQVGPTPNNDTGLFADFPTLGVDALAVYIGVNVFNVAGDSVKGTTGFVLRKSDLLSGILTVTAFRALTDGFSAGIWSPQGVDNDDAGATEGYFIGVDWQFFSRLDIRRISDPGGTPSISGDLTVTVPATYFPIRQVHAGASGNRRLDAIDDRLFAAQLKKNALTGVQSLWTAHNMRVGTTGVAGLTGNRNASRWYELRDLTTTPVLYQSGTLFDPASTNPRGYWIPSVAAAGQGHMALGSSYASSLDYAGVALAGRLFSDAPGTTRPATLGVISSTAYNVEPVDGQRWGDFSQVVVDPLDDMTMWTFQEYCNATNSWAVRVIKLLAPPPAAPASASPPSVEVMTSNVDVTIAGTSSGGSAYFDPGPDFPRHIAASVNGGGVTVNSVTFTDPTHLVMNISVAANAAPGPRTVTVFNPDSQSTTSSSAILTITNADCPAITVSPDTLANGTAGFSYLAVLSAGGGTPPYSFAVTAGALPSGVTLASSGLLSGTPVFGGTYNFTVTAADSALCPGSRAYSWTVTGCPQISVGPTALPNPVFGSPYSQTVTASGGTGPYTFAVTIGSLPTGLSLASGGAITGTPTVLGTWSFTVTATGADACTGSRAFQVSVVPAGGSNSILITALDSGYTQNFNALAATGTSGWLPAGWRLSETGSNANTLYSATDGTANLGDTYSFGASSTSERAYGSLQSASATSTIGVLYTNVSGSPIASLDVSYTGEQWRLGATGRVDRLDAQLSTNATNLTGGTWTDVDALDFTAPVTAGTTGPLNGNANQIALAFTISGLSIPNGGTICLRWLDFNASTADDGLALDDFSLTPHGIVVPTDPAGTGAAVPETLHAGEVTLLTVTVTPGSHPTSTGLAVSADLSAIGGPAAQPFYDDGTHGDAAPDDKVFSYRDSLPTGAPAGGALLDAAIDDAQARTGSATISLHVLPACAPVTLTTPSLPDGEVGVPYSLQLTADGGDPPYTYALGGGSLPPGILLSGGGLLYGTPLASDSFAFTVAAVDDGGCGGSRPYGLSVVQGENIVVTVPSTGLWNLLSNPLHVPNDSVQILFPTAVSSAFSYLPGSGYQLSSRIETGYGYWLKFGTAEPLHIIGQILPADTVDVADGWNLFGSVSDPVPAAAITTPGTAITSDIYGYANGYETTDTIRPGRGYWAKFASSGQLVLGPGPGAVARRGAAHADPAALALTIADARGRSQTLLLLDGGAGVDLLGRYELPPAPPAGTFDIRFASGRRAELAPAAGALYTITLQDAPPPLTLRWTRYGAGDRKAWLTFAGGAGSLLLAGSPGEARVGGESTGSTASLRLEPAERPASFALHQNYPNPFNPATVISFTLPERSRVFLTVVNLLGETVAALLTDASLDAGVHDILFDAKALPSGMYYYRLAAVPGGSGPPVTASGKMLLIR